MKKLGWLKLDLDDFSEGGFVLDRLRDDERNISVDVKLDNGINDVIGEANRVPRSCRF